MECVVCKQKTTKLVTILRKKSCGACKTAFYRSLKNLYIHIRSQPSKELTVSCFNQLIWNYLNESARCSNSHKFSLDTLCEINNKWTACNHCRFRLSIVRLNGFARTNCNSTESEDFDISTFMFSNSHHFMKYIADKLKKPVKKELKITHTVKDDSSLIFLRKFMSLSLNENLSCYFKKYDNNSEKITLYCFDDLPENPSHRTQFIECGKEFKSIQVDNMQHIKAIVYNLLHIDSNTALPINVQNALDDFIENNEEYILRIQTYLRMMSSGLKNGNLKCAPQGKIIISLSTLFQHLSIKFGIKEAEEMLKCVVDGIEITSHLDLTQLIFLYMSMVVVSLGDEVTKYPIIKPYWDLLGFRLRFFRDIFGKSSNKSTDFFRMIAMACTWRLTGVDFKFKSFHNNK